MTYKNWWYTEGSAIRPLPNEDIEEFAKRITEIAWSNGQHKEREACAKVCEDEAWRLKKIAVGTNSSATNNRAIQASNCADEIRARGQE